MISFCLFLKYRIYIYTYFPYIKFLVIVASVVLSIQFSLHILRTRRWQYFLESEILADGINEKKCPHYPHVYVPTLDVGRQVTTTEGGILSVLLPHKNKGKPFTNPWGQFCEKATSELTAAGVSQQLSQCNAVFFF